MRLRASVWIGAIVLVVAGAGAFWLFHPRGATVVASDAPLATPPGIMLRATPIRGRFGPTAVTIAFVDRTGAPLYRFDTGAEPGDSDRSATGWSPAVAPLDAVPLGDWSLVPSPAGGFQWALAGSPLYVRAPGAPDLDDKAGAPWHAAQFETSSIPAPPLGILVRDLPGGGGQALTDDGGLTLYEFIGPAGTAPRPDIARDRCWKPALAPEIARQTGAFSVVAGDDGLRQWAYLGLGLYRFAGDTRPDDANGAGFDPRFRVALTLRYFMPASVAIRHAPGLGDILTTRDGMTLYTRDRFIDADGHDFRTDHGTEATGRALGAAACDVDCIRTWHPLPAEAGALPSGFWDIIVRPDGFRQWAYKGYALYGFSGDRRPGEINGNESYTLMPLGRDDPYPAPPSRPGLGVGAMFWRAVTP
jgi:predicted lipoprotein with Yx(FWY)xxD motif